MSLSGIVKRYVPFELLALQYISTAHGVSNGLYWRALSFVTCGDRSESELELLYYGTKDKHSLIGCVPGLFLSLIQQQNTKLKQEQQQAEYRNVTSSIVS